MHPFPRRHLPSLLAVLAAAPESALAQAWPARPIRLIVPFAPGGITDILGRLIAERLGPALGQTVVVENPSGAGGNIGAALVARAAPDGYTLLLSSPGTSVINQFVYANMPFDVETAFAPVSLVATMPNVLMVHPSVPARTVTEFVEMLRREPDRFSYGSAGNGSSGHLSSELFRVTTGTRIQHVPYRGSSQMLVDLIAGQIQMTIDNIASSIGAIRALQVRPLAVTGAARHPHLPDVPTMAEAGVAGYQSTTWFSVVAPAGTPDAVVARLNREINAILADADARSRILHVGAEPLGGTPADLVAFNRVETARWSRVVELAGIRPG